MKISDQLREAKTSLDEALQHLASLPPATRPAIVTHVLQLLARVASHQADALRNARALEHARACSYGMAELASPTGCCPHCHHPRDRQQPFCVNCSNCLPEALASLAPHREPAPLPDYEPAEHEPPKPTPEQWAASHTAALDLQLAWLRLNNPLKARP